MATASSCLISNALLFNTSWMRMANLEACECSCRISAWDISVILLCKATEQKRAEVSRLSINAIPAGRVFFYTAGGRLTLFLLPGLPGRVQLKPRLVPETIRNEKRSVLPEAGQFQP